jgi:hypothetical protein
MVGPHRPGVERSHQRRLGRTRHEGEHVPHASKIGIGLAGVAAAVSLTACGSDAGDDFAGQSATKIMDQAEKDTKALKSVTLSGTITQDDGKLAIDISADDDGTCSGTMSIGGGKAEVLNVDGASYLRGDEAFWRSTTGDSADQVVALLGRKWAKLPAGNDSFSEFCDLDKVFEDDGDKETYTKGKVTKLAGKDAIEIVAKDDKGTKHAWVATEGKHYLLKVDITSGDEPGSMRLSDFDKPVDAKAPAEDDFVDLGALG